MSEEISSKERGAWALSLFDVVAVCAHLFIAFEQLHTTWHEGCPREKRSRQKNEVRGHYHFLMLLQCVHTCLLHLNNCTQLGTRVVHERRDLVKRTRCVDTITF